MKKRSLKIMSVVLAGVMTTGMILGGCSAGGDKENGGNKEASKELNLWMHNGQAFVDETKKLAENYEKETGVKINIQTFPYDAMSQKMKAAFTAGNEPDIMQVFGAWIPTYMNQKLLAEVPEELSANFETDYLQGAVDGYAKDGTYYGVPIEMNVEYGLFYNREDAAAAGVPDGPKTFDDVMKIAKNSAKFNGDVQEYGGLEFYNGDNFAALFLSWIMQNGGDFWNEDQTKFVLTSPEAKEAWQKLVDLVTVEKVTDTKHITAKMPTEQYFFANKAAQLVKGSWASAVGDDLENENWKYVFMPPVKGDIPYFAVESGWGYVVSENSKNKDTAWDFVKYCMEPENAKEFNLGTGTVASLKAIIDDEGYQSDVGEFFPYYMKEEVLMEQDYEWKNNDFKVVDGWREEARVLFDEVRTKKEGYEEFLKGSGETATYFIRSLATGDISDEMVNVINNGYIDNVSSGIIVELPTYIDEFGLHPQKIGKLPDAIAAQCDRLGREYLLMVEAAATCNYELARQAMFLDPLVSNCKYPELLLKDLIRANLDLLPEAWEKHC